MPENKRGSGVELKCCKQFVVTCGGGWLECQCQSSNTARETPINQTHIPWKWEMCLIAPILPRLYIQTLVKVDGPKVGTWKSLTAVALIVFHSVPTYWKPTPGTLRTLPTGKTFFSKFVFICLAREDCLCYGPAVAKDTLGSQVISIISLFVHDRKASFQLMPIFQRKFKNVPLTLSAVEEI